MCIKKSYAYSLSFRKIVEWLQLLEYLGKIVEWAKYISLKVFFSKNGIEYIW